MIKHLCDDARARRGLMFNPATIIIIVCSPFRAPVRTPLARTSAARFDCLPLIKKKVKNDDRLVSPYTPRLYNVYPYARANTHV